MDDAELVRLTVNITPGNVQALSRAMEISGDHRTDCVNRAIRLYTYLLENVFLQDRELYTADKKGGKVSKINMKWSAVEYGVDDTT